LSAKRSNYFSFASTKLILPIPSVFAALRRAASSFGFQRRRRGIFVEPKPKKLKPSPAFGILFHPMGEEQNPVGAAYSIRFIVAADVSRL
jgi:hypothetical protein